MHTVRVVEVLTDAAANSSANLAATWPCAEPTFADTFRVERANSTRLA